MTACAPHISGRSTAPALSDTSTLVDSDALLHRYEDLLAQLSQQAVEQQAEINALRVALAKTQATTIAAAPSSHLQEKKEKHDHRHRRRRSVGQHCRRSHHASSATPASAARRRQHASIRNATPSSLPLTPELSSIEAIDETATVGGSMLTPLRTYTSAKPMYKQGKCGDEHNTTCDTPGMSSHAGGLSPSPEVHASKLGGHHRLSSPSATPEKRYAHGGSCSSVGDDIAVRLDAGKDRHHLHDLKVKQAASAAEGGINADSALDFLLSVFSSAEATQHTLSTDSPPEVKLVEATTARCLFDAASFDDVSSSTEPSAEAGTTSDAARCGAAASRDCSASELVGHLIAFFTP